MLQVTLKYNPYLVSTELSIDNTAVQPNSSLAVLTQDRLQNWVDKFFAALYAEKRQKNILIDFEGTQLDFNDLAEATDAFQKENSGFDIQLRFKQSKHTDEKRLEKLHQLFEKGKTSPFAEEFNSVEMEMAFARATDPTFEVNVIATMSSGKSTVVNSLLGKELMPSKNEACTATIARIEDHDSMSEFTAQRYDKAGTPLSEVVQADNKILTAWNDDVNTHLIEIKGNIPTVGNTQSCRYVFIDTPGPNNARTAAHEQTTLEAIQSKPLSMVLYVLNATQLSTRDDHALLQQICKEMNRGGRRAHDRFVFIANKIDAFDPEKEESVTKAMENIRQYLREHGIVNPIIIPASAQLAKLLRLERQGEVLTRNERGDLNKFIDLFVEEPEMNMLEHAKPRLSKDCVRRLQAKLTDAQKKNDLKAVAEILSGIPIIEELLNDFLQKHALPAKLKDAVDTFNRILQSSEIAKGMNEQLSKSEEELEKTIKAIQGFTNDKENIKRADAFRKKVHSLNYKISDASNATCRELMELSEKVIEEIGDALVEKKVAPGQARRMIDQAVQRCQSLEAEVNVTLAEALKSEYFTVINKLREEYQEHVASLIDANFPENDSLRNLQTTSMRLPSINEMVMGYTTTEQVKTGTKKVKVGNEMVKTGTKKVKVGSEQVKVGKEKYVSSHRTERYGFLWLFKREIPVYSWRDKFESRDVFQDQDIYETRDVFEERDIFEERKYVDFSPILDEMADTIRKFSIDNIKKFEQEATENVEQAKLSLLSLMEAIDVRVKDIAKQLESANASKPEKERQLQDNRAKVAWFEKFSAEIESVLAI